MVDPSIQKYSDVNHRRGNVKTDLYKLKSVHRSMNTKTINYICHCFSTAIYTNKNDTNAIRNAMLNISSHIFNEHENCGEWCTHKDNPDKPFTRLPNKKPLTGADLKEAIHNIFKRQADHSDALAPNSSSNANESLNRTISSKAPKNIHYSTRIAYYSVQSLLLGGILAAYGVQAW